MAFRYSFSKDIDLFAKRNRSFTYILQILITAYKYSINQKFPINGIMYLDEKLVRFIASSEPCK